MALRIHDPDADPGFEHVPSLAGVADYLADLMAAA